MYRKNCSHIQCDMAHKQRVNLFQNSTVDDAEHNTTCQMRDVIARNVKNCRDKCLSSAAPGYVLFALRDFCACEVFLNFLTRDGIAGRRKQLPCDEWQYSIVNTFVHGINDGENKIKASDGFR